MSPLKSRLLAELEEIQKALDLIPAQLDNLSPLELAGLASIVHSIYNGFENMLKQIFREEQIPMPTGAFWHKDLLENAVAGGILSESTLETLKEYMSFRHFFAHAYSPRIDLERLRPLVENAPNVVELFKADLQDWV